jgi:sugar phosphate isomerase/epimerase
MELSLAGWSLNPQFRRAQNPLKLVDFPQYTRDTFGIDAVELNNIYFESTDAAYLDRLVKAASKAGSLILNVAVDEKGDLSSLSTDARLDSVSKYARWIPIAKAIGATAIRANSGGKDVTDLKAATAACVDSFRRLCDIGRANGIAILIENHWGISADADTMVHIVRSVRETHGSGAMHTLPDFGNWPDEVDRYAALSKVMPFAGAVHAKVNDIDENLVHPRFDHRRCIQIAKDAGYKGYLGIEYEGKDDPAVGIERGARLLRQILGK